MVFPYDQRNNSKVAAAAAALESETLAFVSIHAIVHSETFARRTTLQLYSLLSFSSSSMRLHRSLVFYAVAIAV